MNDKIPASIIQALLGAQQGNNPQTSGAWNQGSSMANVPQYNPKAGTAMQGPKPTRPQQQYVPEWAKGKPVGAPTVQGQSWNRPNTVLPPQINPKTGQPQYANGNPSSGSSYSSNGSSNNGNHYGQVRNPNQNNPKVPRPFSGQNGQASGGQGNQQQMFARLLQALGINMPGLDDPTNQG